MSKVSLGILMAAALLIVLAQYFNLPFVSGGSGVVFLVALGYAYVVAKREAQLLMTAIRVQEENRFRDRNEAVPAE